MGHKERQFVINWALTKDDLKLYKYNNFSLIVIATNCNWKL